jgi:hypothetical protein
MNLLAGKAGDCLIVSGIVRNIFSYKTLHSIARVRAARKTGTSFRFLPRKRNPDLFSIRVSLPERPRPQPSNAARPRALTSSAAKQANIRSVRMVALLIRIKRP